MPAAMSAEAASHKQPVDMLLSIAMLHMSHMINDKAMMTYNTFYCINSWKLICYCCSYYKQYIDILAILNNFKIKLTISNVAKY